MLNLYRQNASKLTRRTAYAAVAIFLGLAFTSAPAQALVELKGGYSLHTMSPGGLNDAFASYPKIDQAQSISIDIMANVPLMPVGLGLRHEMIKRSDTVGALSSEVDWKRTSILINKRFIDTVMYLGPIATIAITNDFKYKSGNSGTTTEYKTDSQLNGTIGLEAGLKLLLLRAGVEAGYMYAPMGNLKTAAGTDVSSGGTNVNVDMSGTYVRATVGFGF